MEIETIVIVLNHNGKKHLKECFESLRRQNYKKFKMVMVDNNSSDKSIEFMKENFSGVELILNDKNLGFSVANNNAIRYVIKKYSPKYIALLNNDTKTDSDWLKELVKCCEEEKCAGVASNMLFYNNPEIINSQGGKLDLWGHGVDVNFGKKRNIKLERREDVLSACFGAVLLNVKYLEKIGLMDERYFAYFEDLDWSWRANNLGFRVVFEPKAIVYHKFGGFWGKENYQKSLFCRQNGLNLVLKNMPLKDMVWRLPFVFLSYFGLFFLNVFFNLNNQMPTKFSKRKKYLNIPFKALKWNFKNLRKTLNLRKNSK